MRDDETVIRRRTDRYRVRRLTAHEDDEGRPAGLLVEEPASAQRRLVVVQFVDFRTGPREETAGVVKFSAAGESLDATGSIRLATPADFRERGYEPGIADDLDAAARADAAPYLAATLSRSGSHVAAADIRATATLASPNEPWIYCTSMQRDRRWDAGTAKESFAASKGRDAVTTAIGDPGAFATRLGIEFALGIEVGTHVRDGGLEQFRIEQVRRALGLAAMPSAEAMVRVYHGPVHYEDRRLVIRRDGDMGALDAVQAWFTKRTAFSAQREYRFAVSVAGAPLWRAVYLRASGELLGLTRRVDGGDRREGAAAG